MLKIFIDTEFTDFLDTHLISIGIAAASGEEFYAEVPYPERSRSEFVCDVVLPLLGRIPHASCTKDDLRGRLLTWLALVRPRNADVEICYDFQKDWDLFADALDGQVPPWCHARLVGREINELLRYEYHVKNKLPEHRALYDAKANRYAFPERPPVAK